MINKPKSLIGKTITHLISNSIKIDTTHPNPSKKSFIKYLPAILLISLLMFIVLPFGYIESKKGLLEEEVYEYLYSKGYEEEDIRSLDGKFGTLPLFAVDVIFVNEPEVIYTYREREEKIIQLDWGITNEAEQKGITEQNISEPKHLE